MNKLFLVITSIAESTNEVLQQFARECLENNAQFVVIGDEKSPSDFYLIGCDYYSIYRQKELNFTLKEHLPYNHYARKNLGYLVAISKGAEIIIETDDDNLPFSSFWNDKQVTTQAHLLENKGWVNIYKYFTDSHIWPRGFALEHIKDDLPGLKETESVYSPIQQGLADENPDVDAIYRLTSFLPVWFNKTNNIALASNSICPFNSQNTTWFKEAFPLLYLPSFCSFRMTDIWRSFIAQRIAWTCGWSIMFHKSTVRQKRNDHNLTKDFADEIEGYCNNNQIVKILGACKLKGGVQNIPENMILCYQELVNFGYFDQKEISLLKNWLNDLNNIK